MNGKVEHLDPEMGQSVLWTNWFLIYKIQM